MMNIGKKATDPKPGEAGVVLGRRQMDDAWEFVR